MRRASCLVGLTVIAWAVTARAEQAAPAVVAAPAPAATESAPAPAPATTSSAPAPQKRRLQIGLAVLPMAHGKISATAAGQTMTVDGAYATGVGLSLGYEVLPGLVLGIAPQAIFKGKVKTDAGDAQSQYDLLLRIAYGYTIPDVVTVYAEVLPGYSTIYPSITDTSSGLVVALGVGAAMDLSDRVYCNLGAGYEMGFQNQTATANYRVNYIRVVLGAGVKF